MPLRILIETVPHSEQRYDTVGDWVHDPDGTWRIRVSDLGHWKFNLLVAAHELVEMALCKDHEVTAAQVDEFDLAWEPHDGVEEPGDDMLAPYWRDHQFASGFERMLAAELCVNWQEYERAVNAQSQSG